MLRVGFIGAGTVGTALAIRLAEKGYDITAVNSRTPASAQRLAQRVEGCRVCDDKDQVAALAELIFVTTPDSAIASVVESTVWRAENRVVHCSGVDSVDILEPARAMGAQVGGFHPLQSFASVDAAIQNIPGSTFALEAKEPLLTELTAIAETMDGNWVRLGPGDKVLYHAAAVIACNYFYTLVKMANDLWEQFGADPSQSTPALLPLIQGSVNNLANVGLPQALTGPIARGDTGTIKKHLEALKTRAPDLVPAYKELGLMTIPIALAKGRVDGAKAEEMQAVLSSAD
jgi:predicted short-subunit dehydrogenase-like oxidoreductase (DUF2520 family)